MAKTVNLCRPGRHVKAIGDVHAVGFCLPTAQANTDPASSDANAKRTSTCVRFVTIVLFGPLRRVVCGAVVSRSHATFTVTAPTEPPLSVYLKPSAPQ